MIRFSALLSLLAATASAYAQLGAWEPAIDNNGVIANSYILEFPEDATGAPGAVTDEDAFRSAVQSLVDLDAGISIKQHHKFKLFKGATFSFKDPDSAQEGLAKLANHKNVKQIWPNRFVRRPTVHGQTNGAGLGMDSSVGPDNYPTDENEYDPDMVLAPYIMTQVDKLHEKGIYGNGTRICVIDTGVDYRMAALGGGFGPGHLIAFGRDLVGDNYTGDGDDPQPDGDPFEECDGHGTGTMGVIASQPGNKYGILGVAPGATFGAYRIYSCADGGGTSTDVQIQSLNLAYEDGCNVISASWSPLRSWSEDVLSIVASRVVAAGVSISSGPGNNGYSGPFHFYGMGTGKGVTSPGSVDNTATPDVGLVANFTVGGGAPQSFKWRKGKPAAWGGVKLPLWAPNHYETNITDRDGDCSKVFPADTPDLSGYVVLLHEKDCQDGNQTILAELAAAHGAKYMILYNDEPYEKRFFSADGVPQILAVAGVRDYQGNEWLKALAAGSTVTIEMADPDTLSPVLTFPNHNPNAGLTSYFTGWGPAIELGGGPDFTAPGGNILTTWLPKFGGPYRSLSGTSFATPFTAGVLALVAQARKTFDPATLQAVLSTTADPKVFSNALEIFPHRAPVQQQGAGTVQAFNAAFTTTLLSRASIALNDTDHLESTYNFTVTNLGQEAVSYNLGHAAAATVYTFTGNDPFPQTLYNLEVTEEHAAIDFGASGSHITVPAGGEATVMFTLTPPALDAKRLPLYSGWITLNGTNGDVLSLPYTGAAGSMKDDVQVIARFDMRAYNDTVHYTDETLAPLISEPGFTFFLPYNFSDDAPGEVIPGLRIDYPFGTAVSDIQVISEDQGGKNLGSMWENPVSYWDAYDREDHDYGYPFRQGFWGVLADGTPVPEGSYMLQLSALKISGDPNNPDDYETARTPSFNIKYQNKP